MLNIILLLATTMATTPEMNPKVGNAEHIMEFVRFITWPARKIYEMPWFPKYFDGSGENML